MLTRRYVTLGLVIVLCALATAGCKRRRSGSTTINTSGIFTTDNFPGSSVQDGNVADDQRAFSPDGGTPQNVRVCFNGDRCQAMVTYTEINFFGGPITGIYAHYYDGSRFSPPTLLQSADGRNALTGGDVICVFLNTANHVSANAQARDGDAIIFWRANDDGTTAVCDAVNTCLYSTYFDVSFVGSAAHNYGFQTFADRLNVDTEAGEDVDTIGVVTDWLCREARWQNGSNSYNGGDATTGIVAVWHQGENNTVVCNNGRVDNSLHAVRFDPAEVLAEDIPLTPGLDTRLALAGFGRSDAGTTSGETQVYDEFATYNNNLVFKVDCAPAGFNGTQPSYSVNISENEDIVLENLAFNLSTFTVSAPQTLSFSAGVILSGDGFENNCDFLTTNGSFLTRNSIYGSDEGLSAMTVFFVEKLDDSGAEIFNEADFDSGRLCITEVDEATGGILERGLMNNDNLTITDHVFPNDVDTRMSRNGDYIVVGWLQNEVTGGFTQNAAWAEEYVTTRILSDGTFPVPDLLASTLSAPLMINSHINGENVTWFEFQEGLGYICGRQSRPDEMNIWFEQSDGTFDQVDRADLVLDPTEPGVVMTEFLTVSEFADDNGTLAGSGGVNGGRNFYGTDSGANGDVVYFYRHDNLGIVGDEYHLWSDCDGTVHAGSAEVDSDLSFRQIADQTLTVIGTPAGSDIGGFDSVAGAYDNSAFHPNEFAHVIFTEDATNFVDSYPDALRTRQFNCEDTGASFVDSWQPQISAPFHDPFELNPKEYNNNLFGTFLYGVTVSGNTLGIYFVHGTHIYYQECGANRDGVGWLVVDSTDAGLITPIGQPALVDDDDSNDKAYVFSTFPGVFTRACTCDTLGCAMVFFEKELNGIYVSPRLQVRTHQ